MSHRCCLPCWHYHRLLYSPMPTVATGRKLAIHFSYHLRPPRVYNRKLE